MSDILGIIVGNIVNFVGVLAHLIHVLFRNFILLAFVLAFFYGLFRLCQNGWRKLRGPGAGQEHSDSAPEDETNHGGG